MTSLGPFATAIVTQANGAVLKGPSNFPEKSSDLPVVHCAANSLRIVMRASSLGLSRRPRE
jgi:hypothetical protein